MPIQASPENLAALGGGLLPRCENRSLFQDRFADPHAKDDVRKTWFNALIGRKSAVAPVSAEWLPAGTETLLARLMARMMVNLAGGVMENANVLLDRYGLPVIPGSAIKACARRMALQALHDWVAADPEADGTEDIGRPCRIDFTEPADMLAAIARVFGWVGQDWSTGREGKDGPWRSDLAWATGGDAEILKSAKEKAGNLESFAGTVAFLPASPNADPGLELDVVTPHHTEYYQSTDPNAKAADIEDPIPVFFPAVKAQKDGDYFTFALVPLQRANADSLRHAMLWLRNGLEIFGIGAKTNAGYGWFDPSEEMNRRINDLVVTQRRVQDLDALYADFAICDEARKEEILLELGDRKADCQIWQKGNSAVFSAILQFAETQEFDLL